MLKFTIESIDAESIMDMLLEKFSIHLDEYIHLLDDIRFKYHCKRAADDKNLSIMFDELIIQPDCALVEYELSKLYMAYFNSDLHAFEHYDRLMLHMDRMVTIQRCIHAFPKDFYAEYIGEACI